MPKLLNLNGRKFGRLRVLRFVGFNKWHQAMWSCLCKCGTKRIVHSTSLVSGLSKSCGCFNSDKSRRRRIESIKRKIKPGQRFDRLVVVRRSNIRVNRRSVWHCLCDCGNFSAVVGTCLLVRNVRSCGCLKQGPASHGWKHGGGSVHVREYRSWYGAIQRCHNPKNIGYEDYGGRGIKVCDRWQGRLGFLNFLEDMGKRPEAKTLDRINVMGNYEPDNCRWADAKTQIENQRRWMTPEQLEELKKRAEEETSEDFYGGEHPF